MRPNFRRIVAALVGAVAAGALVAACGGGDDAPSTSPSAAASTATRPASTATAVTSATTTPAAGTAATPTVAAATPAPQPTQPRPQATQPAPKPTVPPPPPPPPPPAAISLTVIAKGLRFLPTRLSAPSGATLSVTLDNQDAGTAHDISFKDPSGAKIAATEIFNGLDARTVTFPVAGPGDYGYQCTVHPFQMNGILTVQ